MKTVNMTVNGNAVSADVEPRTHLADFLRDTLNLTGTHLGCEHGVCGACTLIVDGMPVRSCITLAIACDGARVTTIEGLDEDEIGRALREAFSREHALQCGYCTPGMLVAARDIVVRMPAATEHDIRVAMSGNLCRCTGYVGIVRAIQSVIAGRKSEVRTSPARSRTMLGPAGSGYARPATAASVAVPVNATGPAMPAHAADHAPDAMRLSRAGAATPQTTLNQRFTVDHPRDQVWDFFGRLDEVTACLPGASVVGKAAGDHVRTRMKIKAGPIVAVFDGEADVVRDASNYSGVIRGSAQDTRSRSNARGEIRYALFEDRDGTATRIEIELGFTLTGPLAQFSRSNIVHDIARRMTESFVRNLHARLGHGIATADAPPVPAEINAFSLVFAVLWTRIKAFVRTISGR